MGQFTNKLNGKKLIFIYITNACIILTKAKVQKANNSTLLYNYSCAGYL